jgi:hypothetical protein
VTRPLTASQRIAGAVLGGLLLLAGVLLGLYGLFAILYRGDSHGNGNTYVEFGSRDINAHLVGALALLLACLVTFVAVTVLRVSRRSTR